MPGTQAYAIILLKIRSSPLAVIMQKVFFVIAVFSLLVLSALAQIPPRHPGPVVSAYLTSLGEELRELEYQISRQEISRRDYDRAKQRLSLTRSIIEQRARSSSEDRVPELQVLLADELRILSEEAAGNAAKLRPGAVIDRQWKLVTISTPAASSGFRFYVFEKANASPVTGETKGAGAGNDDTRDEKMLSLASSQASPQAARSVIETVVIRTNPPATRKKIVSEPPPPPVPVTPPPAPVAPASQINAQRLRIQKIFVPKYSDKALAANINGEILMSALFRRDGKVKEVKVVRGLGYGLDERVSEALKQTIFEPAQLEGQPIDLRLQLAYLFRDGKVNIQMQTEQMIPRSSGTSGNKQ